MLRVLVSVFLMFAPMAANATSEATALPDAEVRGSATYRFVGFPLYKARLFTEAGAPLDWSRDFGLELEYLRNLTEKDLVEGTMREFTRLGTSLPIREQLEICFEDVRKGDRFVAVSRGQDRIAFWLNGQPTCTLTHPRIKSHFMGIFLGDNTRSKTFTQELKGE